MFCFRFSCLAYSEEEEGTYFIAKGDEFRGSDAGYPRYTEAQYKCFLLRHLEPSDEYYDKDGTLEIVQGMR